MKTNSSSRGRDVLSDSIDNAALGRIQCCFVECDLCGDINECQGEAGGMYSAVDQASNYFGSLMETLYRVGALYVQAIVSEEYH